ncbi:MAG TPA: thiamine pyrophosphate-binding protein [Candidatus Saccharimonadales bacterium]|nr:thiamine pyrophosphate-binding protein [Candidatus Saccharimonadales bacterium]
MSSVARLIGERLRSAGVRHVFGHPGGEVVDLIEGFRAAGLEFVLAKHETAAAFMAEAMASSSGRPGACVATLGPGATNLVTGVAHAYLDRSPLIALTGQLPVDRYETVTHQKLDLRALFAPITKWQTRVSAANAGAVTDRALSIALQPRQGPVFLEVPSDVPSQDAAPGEADPAPQLGAGVPDHRSVAEAAALLDKSARPVLFAGLDALDAATAEPLRRFIEAWGIAAILSPKAKGLLRDDHPLVVGTIEGLGSAKLYEWVARRDLVVMVGFDPVEFDRDWTSAAPVIHLSPLPNGDGYYRSAVELVGPVPGSLDALRASASPKDTADVARFRDEFRRFVRPQRSGLTAQDVLGALRAALPEDALVSCDVGFNKSVSIQCWPAYTPRTFFVSNGLSSMGYGLPAAIGLKLAHPERAVACILGDGGFAMSVAELETAARLGLAFTVVVLADEALQQIKAGQERKGFPVTGTTFGALDYRALATAFGADGIEARTLDECRAAFRDSARSTRVTLIAAHVDPTGYRL